MSRTWTNGVRFAVAALLGLVRLPGGLVAARARPARATLRRLTPAAAAPTQNTPTPTKTPTATSVRRRPPTATVAPPPPARPSQPTHKPTKKPTHSSGAAHRQPPPDRRCTTTARLTLGQATPPRRAPRSASRADATRPARRTSHRHPGTRHRPRSRPRPRRRRPPRHPPAHRRTEATADAQRQGRRDQGERRPRTPSTPYLDQLGAGGRPSSAPVWVVPGILLVLTSMLALLGGVLGRGNRPALARVKALQRDRRADRTSRRSRGSRPASLLSVRRPVTAARLPRDLHPVAWWVWALGLATAASFTTNPLVLLTIVGGGHPGGARPALGAAVGGRVPALRRGRGRHRGDAGAVPGAAGRRR